MDKEIMGIKITNQQIALGLITRHFNDAEPINRFLDNARDHNHHINRVIVAYSHSLDPATLAAVSEQIRLDLIHVPYPDDMRRQMEESGVSAEAIQTLLELPNGGPTGEVPYGAYRNAVLFKALLEGMDYLLFFDTDVEPRVLTRLEGLIPHWEDIDFIGTHMRSLVQEHVSATTSEYSGYYIIPPISFTGLSDLLNGLGKGMALEYMEECKEHRCLNLGPISPGLPSLTLKPLGGNLGLDLSQAWRLAPFFSTLYSFSGLTVKGRGEDTLLGQTISSSGGRIMDVDLRIFHHTYDNFPDVPDIRKKSVRDRFYWACLGWIGRNPFLSWYLDQQGLLDTDWRSETTLQRIGLEVGGELAAVYLDDDRFRHLISAFESSFAALPKIIEHYQRLMHGWEVFLGRLGLHRPPTRAEDDQLPDLRIAS